jgi:ADP-ribosylglycohydrolase
MTAAVLLGADTDTVAAIAGGILGGASGQGAPHDRIGATYRTDARPRMITNAGTDTRVI